MEGAYHSFEIGSQPITSCAFANGDSPLLAFSSMDGSVTIADASPDNPRIVHLLIGHTNAVTDFAWTLSNALILSVSLDKTARVWNADTGECIRIFYDTAELFSCSFDPLNFNLVIVGAINQLKVGICVRSRLCL